MKTLILIALLALLPLSANAKSDALSPDATRSRFDSHAKDMVPLLQTTSCRTIHAAKLAGKTILECKMRVQNSLLSIDAMNGQITGIWLMIDATNLEHPSDIRRAGGTLIRMARNTSYGDHLQVASDALLGAHKEKGKASCIDDAESASRLCITTDDGRIYDMTLEPIRAK